jgi:hypothetical protein
MFMTGSVLTLPAARHPFPSMPRSALLRVAKFA